jgi:hypothetical protein
MAEELNERERNEILVQQISRYVEAGWHVRNQTETTANLVMPKKFSFWWALLWFVLGVIPLIIYVIYYANKQDRSMLLSVDEVGNITVADS